MSTWMSFAPSRLFGEHPSKGAVKEGASSMPNFRGEDYSPEFDLDCQADEVENKRQAQRTFITPSDRDGQDGAVPDDLTRMRNKINDLLGRAEQAAAPPGKGFERHVFTRSSDEHAQVLLPVACLRKKGYSLRWRAQQGEASVHARSSFEQTATAEEVVHPIACCMHAAQPCVVGACRRSACE